jgi:hypothetical protein
MESQAKDQLSDDTLPKGKLRSFLNDGSKYDNSFEDERGGSNDFAARNAKQIAELFPETTILFADIAGFTAWASSREPSHVFTLLETLYGAFDRQARRMGEYGDCGWCNRSCRVISNTSLFSNLDSKLQESSKLRPSETLMWQYVDYQSPTGIMLCRWPSLHLPVWKK